MKIRLLVLILSLAFGGQANTDIKTVVEALEISASNITLPTAPNGRLMFRPCSTTCNSKFVLVRLTPETAYFVQNKTLDFSEFRKAFYETRSSASDYALVTYAVESNTVTSISIGL